MHAKQRPVVKDPHERTEGQGRVSPENTTFHPLNPSSTTPHACAMWRTCGDEQVDIHARIN